MLQILHLPSICIPILILRYLGAVGPKSFGFGVIYGQFLFNCLKPVFNYVY